MKSEKIAEILNYLGIHDSDPIAGCSVCNESNGIDLHGTVTEDKKYINLFYCQDCNKLSYQILDNNLDNDDDE